MVNKFKALPIGAKFKFAPSSDGFFVDPFEYVRTGARTYEKKPGASFVVGSVNADVIQCMPDNVATFCASLAHAIRNREFVSIASGIFSPGELSEVLAYLKGAEK